MDPATMALIASAAGAGIGAFGQERANKQNRDIAREQMRFQQQMAHSAEAFSERMSSTAYQRKVEDLRKAGLNPALAYESGGASSPVGVTAGGSTSRSENVMRDAPQLAASALTVKQLSENVKLTQYQQHVAAEQARNILEDTNKKIEEKHLLDQQYKFNEILQPLDIRSRAATALIQELGIPGARTRGEVQKLLDLPLQGWKSITEQIQQLIPRR